MMHSRGRNNLLGQKEGNAILMKTGEKDLVSIPIF